MSEVLMFAVLEAIGGGVNAAGIAGLVYTGTVAAAAFAATLSRQPARRRAAKEVLRLLLRCDKGGE
jgi:hypothetical protein